MAVDDLCGAERLLPAWKRSSLARSAFRPPAVVGRRRRVRTRGWRKPRRAGSRARGTVFASCAEPTSGDRKRQHQADYSGQFIRETGLLLGTTLTQRTSGLTPARELARAVRRRPQRSHHPYRGGKFRTQGGELPGNGRGDSVLQWAMAEHDREDLALFLDELRELLREAVYRVRWLEPDTRECAFPRGAN